ncbi:MAG TPA: hydrolase 2, exosortase A system-associated [Candidatus Accumulibacter phosphatis]|nr:MAG: exosortase A system-associated hydrolase 2 [Candidatus Accumulibacter sp. SK-11]HAY27925.1 hydrolase 2, exosortase A system-associated [Accumulibacter sp.]HCN67399.1 hydrolase 2, exosortase A system-associated [Accumulibacter sp.]HRL76031.1 hydrolase 2, exosortase A system-associated [Candidatus Accumulibacter phosphatis]HRQ95515.1 hydrolase 2, exosortase A system-associated [Candidatus Accumulibacter phosphatis]
MAAEAFFLPASPGQRFALLHSPEAAGQVRGAVVYVPPFAEELNKSRRMAALQARAMAVAGYVVLQIDLLGCGDSSGELVDASWEAWLADVQLACDWLQQRNVAPLWLWSHRAGCLLANEAANRMRHPVDQLFWQPVLSGRQYLQQFMRLRLAAGLAGGESRGVMDELRQQLRQGQPVEIAGYMLSPTLAGGLEKAELLLPHRSGRVEWIEISSRPDAGLSPAAAARLTQWQAAGQQVRGTVVNGPAFWQTSEISECSELLPATLLAMQQGAVP